MTAIALNTDRLINELKRIVRASEELLHATRDMVGDKAHEVRARVTETLHSAKHTCRELEDKAIDGAKAADKAIRDHPYPSLGIAFGAGLLVGVLVCTRS